MNELKLDKEYFKGFLNINFISIIVILIILITLFFLYLPRILRPTCSTHQTLTASSYFVEYCYHPAIEYYKKDIDYVAVKYPFMDSPHTFENHNAYGICKTCKKKVIITARDLSWFNELEIPKTN